MSKPRFVWIAERRERVRGRWGAWKVYMRQLPDGGWAAPAFGRRSECEERCRTINGLDIEYRPVKYARMKPSPGPRRGSAASGRDI